MPAEILPSVAAPRRRFPAGLVGVALVFALFGWGVVELFELRFAAGDVYPPYSTLRNDPLGAAAFYEALASLPGLRVERNRRPLDQLGKAPGVIFGHAPGNPSEGGEGAGPLTVFYLGADPLAWPTALDRAGVWRLEEILNAGGRVVMTFLPADAPLTVERLEYVRRREPGDAPEAPSAKKKKRSARAQRQRDEARSADLVDRWGIDFERDGAKRDGTKNGGGAGIPNLTHDPFALPTPVPGSKIPAAGSLVKGQTAAPRRNGPLADAGSVPWHSRADFDVTLPGARAAGWRAWYLRDGKPVVVARAFGQKGGVLVLASDSYFLSNEALRAEPRAGLLAGLVGDGRRVVFDESHHGVEESPGLMTLARRYGLQGALAATGLLVGLFIWRNVSSLVPPPAVSAEAQRAAGTVTGRDSAAGFLNLLRRGVPTRELVGTCVTQWQSGAGRRAPDPAVVARVRALAAEQEAGRVAGRGMGRGAGGRSPAAAYRALCAAVKARG